MFIIRLTMPPVEKKTCVPGSASPSAARTFSLASTSDPARCVRGTRLTLTLPA